MSVNKSDPKLGAACEHGHLARQCDLCQLTRELADKTRECERLNADTDTDLMMRIVCAIFPDAGEPTPAEALDCDYVHEIGLLHERLANSLPVDAAVVAVEGCRRSRGLTPAAVYRAADVVVNEAIAAIHTAHKTEAGM